MDFRSAFSLGRGLPDCSRRATLLQASVADTEEVLGKLAAALNVPLEDLKQYDNRGPIADLKRLMDSDPKLGVAFRTAVEKLKSGELTAEDLIARLSKPPRKK